MRSIATIAALLALLVAGCGGDDGEDIPVTINQNSISPATIPLAGEDSYTFNVVNEDDESHAFKVEGNGVDAQTDTLDPGQAAKLTVELSPGTYDVYCPIGNHRQRGIDGQIVVGSGENRDTGTTEGSGSGYG